MADQYIVNSGDLTIVADSIRAKTGGTDQLIFPSGFKTAIESIQNNISIDNGYTITFMSNGNRYAIQSITQGQSINSPTPPISEGQNFNGWYTDETDGEYIDFPYRPSGDLTLYARFLDYDTIIVGVTGLTSADGILTLTDDLANIDAYSTSTNGDYVSVSNPLSAYWPFNQIEEFTDSNENVFVKFPKLWMKWENDSDGNVTGYKFANKPVSDTYFVPDAFLDPFNTTQDNYLDYFALGKYEMSGSFTKGYSKPNANCLVNITRASARSAARAYGDATNLYNGYQQLDFAQWILYNLLCMMFYRISNIQKVYGGRTGLGTVASWSGSSVTGTCDGVDGMDGWNISTDCVKMLGVENPYGNIYKWVDGVVFSGSTIYTHRYPQQYSDTSSNAIALGISRPTENGWVKSLKNDTSDQTQSYVYPSATGGSSSTYYGDYSYYNNDGVVLSVGGNWNDTSAAGLWFSSGYFGARLSRSDFGARLSYRPL